MITLMIDTSHSICAVGIAKEGVLIDSIQEVLKKKHSERLVCAIDELLKRNNVDKASISEVCVTDGPGSYTGMRIGLTFAKVLALTLNVNLYTVDTLASLVGKKDGFAFIDARSKRVFGAYIHAGVVDQERIYMVDELQTIAGPFYGDTHLLEQETQYLNICENMLELRDTWALISNPDVLVPRYLS
ncbi:hypothetical protein AOC36_03400 [Erysipelothrix larvae]|uniref:Gcp-like domain-containing protein n=1 Tax=Erysipelothrix larvae TaxID=1514105 RepID=A0A0X8GZ17_9FIRM|nr:tRNA (adenosine(37)-N6)-threonylcarbamoyltransferase complex dimerization subunit type 1 TsaB [Erysipelothrix larvae]AMC93054.1 hypothetical protein AOC36_03400 [Erysipelothrix larvae]